MTIDDPTDTIAPEPGPSALDEVERAAIQRRTLGVLFASSTVGRAGMTIVFAVAALLVQEILGSGTWAGASTAAVTIGTAVSASMLSNLMSRRGRRPGLTIGLAVAAGGALVALVGGQRLNLIVYLVGVALIGVGQGATNLSRYAAADLALPTGRGKAISYVVFASTVGAVGGPALVGMSGRLAESMGLDELVGPFILAIGFFSVAALTIAVLLRPDPLVISGGLRAANAPKGGLGEGVRAIMAEPLAQLAALGLLVSQAVMVMVMAMTPLHMDAHGHGLGTIGWILSVHTAGMFAFAPIAGWSSDRLGRIPTLLLGGGLLVVSTILTALAGEAPHLLMFPGLFLLGLGWSFGMVGSSALLTDSVPAGTQVSAQGAADFFTSFASGAGALASGFVFTMAGFHILSMIGIAASGMIVVLSYYRHRLQPPAPIV